MAVGPLKKLLIDSILILSFVVGIFGWKYGGKFVYVDRETVEDRWSEGKAIKWYAKQSWPVGPNFTPSTAENQLEFWQKATWDPDTIDRELGFLHDLGMNTVRVFLHYLPFLEDKRGFLRRMNEFLSLCAKHKVKMVPVPFDDVWDPFPRQGTQCPGKLGLLNTTFQDSVLRDYLQTVVRKFRNDERILFWDLYNEPSNPNSVAYGKEELSPHKKPELTLALLKKVFAWARAARPSQPVTSGVWQQLNGSPIQNFQLSHSDIITFHRYAPLEGPGGFQAYHEQLVSLQGDRPMVCTEYMARTIGSTFQGTLPYAKAKKVGALNWGFVNGKTQTIYPWNSWVLPYFRPPKVWFHDVLWKDGSPFSEDEAAFIKNITRVDDSLSVTEDFDVTN